MPICYNNTKIRKSRECNSQGCIQMGVTDIRQDALLLSERKANGDEENAYFLECGGMLLRCLGLHPIQKRPSSLNNALTSILDGKRRLRSCLTCLVLSEPHDLLNAAKKERYFCICKESRPALLRKVWLRGHARDVFNLAVAFVRMGSLWHGPLARRLP